MMKRILIVLCGLVLVACSDSSNPLDPPTGGEAEWADDADLIVSESIVDPVGDFDPSEPPYQVQYAAVDIVEMSFGEEDGFFYVRLDYAGVIPTGPVTIPADGPVEQQTVTGQSTSFVMDSDGDDMTGAGTSNFVGDGGVAGVDIFFGISLDYGGPPSINANYDFQGNDIHLHQGQIIGELGAGGPGYDFVVVRYDISGLDARFWPAGDTVEVGGWAEAESNLYHEFVNDFLVPRNWTVPL